MKLPERLSRLAGSATAGSGVVAAVILAIVVDVASSRTYRRFDWTESGRYTLSSATLATLSSLPGNVDVYVLVGPGDPLGPTLRAMLEAYGGVSSKITPHFLDPDRDGTAIADLRRRFDLEAGKGEAGRAVRDAVLVVVSGERHWIVAPEDLFEITGEGDTGAGAAKVKSRAERALTGAVRAVTSGDKSTVCFTIGHRELSYDGGGPEGLATLVHVLESDNFATKGIDPGGPLDPGVHTPFDGCTVVVVAAPEEPFPDEDANRLRTYLLEGGNALVATGPVLDSTEKAFRPSGLATVLAPFGIGADDDLVIEDDPLHLVAREAGAGFFADARVHPVTNPLVAGGVTRDPPKIPLYLSRSFQHVAEPGGAAAVDLLATSDRAFGLPSWPSGVQEGDAPPRTQDSLAGPLIVAMAGERARPNEGTHGARIVVVGAGSALAERNWVEPGRRGTALFVENAIGWLAARAPVLDVPERDAKGGAFALSEETRLEVRRYVVFLMPLATALLGFAIFLWRKASEGRDAVATGAVATTGTGSTPKKNKKKKRERP